MKVSELINKLNKLDPNLTIVGYDSYEECLTSKVTIKVLEHTGIEHNPWHHEQTFKSGIKAGKYVQISYED